MPHLPPSLQRLEALRAEVREIESAGQTVRHECLPFGVDAIDCRMSVGGLPISALHEMTGDSAAPGDDAAATLFVAGIAARRSACGMVLWALGRPDLFAPGLAQVGLTSDSLIQAECGRDENVLAVMEEGLQHGGLSVVVGEIGRVTMASTRRLQLAAEASGTTALLLKRWRRGGEDPLGLPSAAATRWRIGCLPSEKLSVPGVGRARWRIELARQRGGQSFQWIMEASDAEGCLALPAKPFHRSAEADQGEARQAA